MAKDDRDDQPYQGAPTPFEKPGGPPVKRGGRGKLPVSALALIFFGILVAIAVVIAVIAVASSGSGSNGSTTGVVDLVSLLLP